MRTVHRPSRILYQGYRADVIRAYLNFSAVGVALGLLSLALSDLTTTARAKLWLGPQTVILGSVGLLLGLAVALAAWRSALAPNARLFDRPLLARGGVLAVIIGCFGIATA